MGKQYTNEMRVQQEQFFEIARRATRVVFISEWVKRYYAENIEGFNAADERWRVINNAVDLEKFKPASSDMKRPLAVGMFGNHRQEFRVRTLFETVSRLKEVGEVKIVGKLSVGCREVLERETRRKRKGLRVTVIEWQPADSLADLYRSCDVLFHPVSGEPCGTVLPEALACGVPVVVPEYGGPAEYVGEGGVLVPYEKWKYDDGFVDAMAAGLRRVIEDIGRYRAGARRAALAKLDLETAATRWAEVFTAATSEAVKAR